MDPRGEAAGLGGVTVHQVRGSRLLNASRGVMPYYLAVESVAVVLPLAVPGRATTARDLMWFGVLLFAAVLQAELSAQAERMRRFFAGNPYINVCSVWTMAGLLTVSPILACLLALLIYVHLWLRVWRGVPTVRLYRVVCSAATAVVTVRITELVLEVGGLAGEPPGFLSIVVAALSYAVVNTVLSMIGLKLHEPRRPLLSLVGSRAENALENVTFCLGGATAILLVAHPTLVLLMVLPVVALPRGELGRRLALASDRDHKTGVLTIAAWRKRADAEVSRAAEVNDSCGILMIDVDHFKRINDKYGHLTGDVVLRLVADAVHQEVRAYDSVGRFGGEEFVVLLPGLGQTHAIAVAERIRDAVAKLVVDAGETAIKDVSVSVGVAVHPAAGDDVERILGAADKAVYLAKSLGRNRVCASGFA